MTGGRAVLIVSDMSPMFSVLFASFIASSLQLSDIKSCSTTAPLQLVSGYIQPDPPIKDQDLSVIMIIDNTGAPVTEGVAVYSSTLNGFPVYSNTSDLCKEVACPVASGQTTYNTTNIWSLSITGKLVNNIRWNTLSGAELFCADVVVKIPFFNLYWD